MPVLNQYIPPQTAASVIWPQIKWMDGTDEMFWIVSLNSNETGWEIKMGNDNENKFTLQDVKYKLQ